MHVLPQIKAAMAANKAKASAPVGGTVADAAPVQPVTASTARRRIPRSPMPGTKLLGS